jgi:DNA-directed RNA polymerase subunit RPC12/RpoP
MKEILSVNQKPIICPKCGSYKIGDIIYGETLQYYQSNPLIINGGCMIADGLPHYQCIDCFQEFNEYGKSLI